MHAFTRPLLALLLSASLLPLARAAGEPAEAGATVATVTAAVNDLYARLDSGDVQAFSAWVAPEGFTEFNTEGDALHRLDMAYFTAAMTSGAKIDLHVTDLQVHPLHDAAVVTGYRTGSITTPDGHRFESRQALTMVWNRTAAGWRLFHVHLSATHG